MADTHIGIDPGRSGAIAFLRGDEVWTVKLADHTDRDVLDALRDAAFPNSKRASALLELVGARPDNSRVGAFSFGVSYGSLRMALHAADIRFETVTPQKWQAAMRCLTKGDKNISKAKAQEMFPSIKITHAIADALLIAEYCRRTS